MDKTILNFWLNNKKYWICTTNEIKEEADKIIYENFYNYNTDNCDFISKIIYLDQFNRHFSRLVKTITDDDIFKSRQKAIDIVLENIEILENLKKTNNKNDNEKILFCLFPFKHVLKYDFIFKFLEGIDMKSNERLSKFYNDTYTKAYNFEKIKEGIKIYEKDDDIDVNYNIVCDFYSNEYKHEKEWIKNNKIIQGYQDELSKSISSFFSKISSKILIVSISGGVDSMSMLHYFSNFSNVNVYAIHIIYNNRKDSELEFQFVCNFCKRIGIKLYYYRIEWLKRNCVERDLYEKTTRNIRFMVYKAICDIFTNPIVLLGHIKEDVIENIWTNISKCQNISNLKKMNDVDVQKGVNIGRPLLNLSKNHIYSYSKIFDIPYLKNTTPSWSNRGKFRERFYKETLIQFGESVDEKVIQFSKILQQQSNILDKLIYNYVIKTYDKDNKSLDITRAVDSELDINDWSILFERICHKCIFCKKPSANSIENFVDRLKNIKKKNIKLFKIQLGKNMMINIKNENMIWKMFLNIS
jgi:tRNA(Ile)-lysidine synthetase-like protein